jgi:hypothetical protein
MNIPAANNDLYDGEPAGPPRPPPLPNLVHPDDLERVLLRMPEELIPSMGFSEIPLDRVRTTPGFYFVHTGSQAFGLITEYLVYVPNQARYPGRPEAPRNVRGGMNALRVALGERPAVIEAGPEPLNVLILFWRRITTAFNPPEIANEADRRRFITERTWSFYTRGKTAESLQNFPNVAHARFFRNDTVLQRRNHALATWAATHGLSKSRRRRSNRSQRKATRRQRSRRF